MTKILQAEVAMKRARQKLKVLDWMMETEG